MTNLTTLRADLLTLENHFRLAVEEGNFMQAARLRDRMSELRKVLKPGITPHYKYNKYND